jgi:hypothetical protein
MPWELLSGEKLDKVRIGDRRELRELCPSLPVPLRAAVEKGLQKHRERRWQTARLLPRPRLTRSTANRSWP